MYYVYDPESIDPPVYLITLDTALHIGKEMIDVCRQYCDPEWPSTTENIVVYEYKEKCEDWEEIREKGIVVAKATQVNIQREGDPGTEDMDFGGVDFYCDYEMRLCDGTSS